METVMPRVPELGCAVVMTGVVSHPARHLGQRGPGGEHLRTVADVDQPGRHPVRQVSDGIRRTTRRAPGSVLVDVDQSVLKGFNARTSWISRNRHSPVSLCTEMQLGP